MAGYGSGSGSSSPVPINISFLCVLDLHQPVGVPTSDQSRWKKRLLHVHIATRKLKTRLSNCENSKMSEVHRDVMVKQKTHSEIPQKSPQPPAKPYVVTAAVLWVLEARVADVIPVLGFVFLTYNVVDALFKAGSVDYKTISCVVFTNANLVALFCCVKSLERSPPKKRRLKVAMWICATSLCLPFCTLLNLSILDSVVTSSFAWTLAVASTVGAFYELFLVS